MKASPMYSYALCWNLKVQRRDSQLALPTDDGKYTLSPATYVSRDYPQKGEFSRFSFGGRSSLGRLERVGRRPRTNRYVNSKGSRQTWEIRVAHFSGAMFTECLIFAYQYTHISTYQRCHVSTEIALSVGPHLPIQQKRGARHLVDICKQTRRTTKPNHL